MEHVLKGQLDEDALANLLQYLSRSRASGCLQLTQSPQLNGAVFFEGGQVVFISTGSKAGIPALSDLLNWPSGDFNFQVGVRAPQHNLKLPVERLKELSIDSLLLEAAYQADVNKLEQDALLSETSILEPKPIEQQSQTVALNLRALHLLRHLDGKRNLSEIATSLDMPVSEALKAARELRQQSLADVISGSLVPFEFLDKLTSLAINIMGPMAEIVIDDALYDLELQADALLERDLAKLLEEIGSQFKRPDWREEFKRLSTELCAQYQLSC